MTFRALTLLTTFLMLASLSGCGTDTKAVNESGGSGFTANHFDFATTPQIIEGYVIKNDANGEAACSECHKTDQSDVTINRQWADSAHAGHILTAGVVQDTAEKFSAWSHYDWDKTNDTVVGDRTGRAACQRCHTTTGVSNFLAAPTTYNPANNDFSHLSNWTASTGSPQQELLYCWGCHSAAGTGVLRNPGSLTFSYSNGASATYPDVAASNVCVACHTGAEIGDSIKGSTGDFANLSFVNSHYLTAGGQVFAVNGYEYAGQNYNVGYHRNIGVANVWNTGNAGPCVSCHMSGDQSHTWGFLAKDNNGTITANQSTLCTKCHAEMSPATLESEKEIFAAALEGLNLALQAKGIFFAKSYPYFFKSASDHSIANAFKNWDGVNVGTVEVPILGQGKDVMGAAFNYNLIEHDPGAFAHNNTYALKLIADSIDFLNDGLVDGDLNEANELLGKGINTGSEAGYAAVHNTVAAETTCSACHSSAPHYGGSAAYSTGGVWSGTSWSGTTNVLGKGQYLFVGVTCSECHTSNMTNASILPQYSESGHGNVMGDAWIHYNWKMTLASATLVGSSNRSGCARCHTSTGYKAAMLNPNSPTPPFAADNGDAGNPAEVLSCGACHLDVTTGVLRNPGAVTPKSTGNPPAILVKKTLPTDVLTTAIDNLPDAGKSNGCNYCHVGGGNMFSLWSTSRIPTHHAVAAGVLYGTTTRIGYEFVNAAETAYLDYTIPAFITSPKHADIGMIDGKGPCASCHMPNLDHHFSVVDERSRTITAQAVCNTCHTVGSAYEMSYAKLEEEKEGYNDAGALLAAYIANTITNYKGAAVTGAVTVHNDRAAWYNSKLFPNEEAGAFAHNRFYVKRLMFDSIDWLQDGVLNGTLTINADTYPSAAVWFGAPTGTVGSYLVTTRP